MGKAVGVAHDEVVKGVAGHLGRQAVVLLVRGQIAQLVVGHHQHVEIRGKQIRERGADAIAEAGLQDVLFELGIGAEDQSALVQLHRPAVEKPGLHGCLRQLLGENIQNLLPNILNRIHHISTPKGILYESKLLYQKRPCFSRKMKT